ncbi:MAG: hypothetical protein H6Q72_4946 [Firmicutes bacterium]|nr:hypothetical protein [Bacillota bacterium]
MAALYCFLHKFYIGVTLAFSPSDILEPKSREGGNPELPVDSIKNNQESGMKMPSLNSQAVGREFESVARSRKIKPSMQMPGRLDLLPGGNTREVLVRVAVNVIPASD